MNIALVIPYNPLEEIGGLEVGTVRLAQAFKKLGHKPIIVTKGKSGKRSGIFIKGKKNMAEISNWLIKNDRLDIVQWMEIFPEPEEINIQCFASGLLRHFGKKVFLMVATSKNLEKRGDGKLTKTLIKNAFDGYIISNSDQIREFKKYGITENIFPFGFGIDTKDIFYPISSTNKIELRKQLNLPVDKTLLLFMGRFVERKRADFLLNVWCNLTHLYDKTSLVMVGSGMGQHDSNEKKIINLIKRSSNLIHREFGPKLNPSEYYQASDMLILPSDREGQPNVLLEAMACGIPVIGSNIPGIVELLHDKENGFVFSVNNPQELSQAIEELVENEELRINLGKEGRKLILRMKDIYYVAKQYIKIYEK
ncbi:MAG: glycosyltransferase [Candidatus Nealsonbacteria bacterium]|nr:glycosyltransferase [Candidatus Nealsonbacteria bacterium]